MVEIKSDPATGPAVAQRVGRGIALPFHDRGTRRRWVVSVTPRPYFTPEKDTVPIVQEAGWAPGPVRTGAENLDPPPGFDPRPSSPLAVAIPAELPCPRYNISFSQFCQSA